MGRRRYTEQQFRSAAALHARKRSGRPRRAVADPTVTTIAELCRRLSIRVGGGNYDVLRDYARRLGIHSDLFSGGKRPRRQHLAVDLADHDEVARVVASSRTLAEAIRRLGGEVSSHAYRRCEQCRRTRWGGRPIPLELDHVDGDRTNNHLENLRLLCPNCHALTPTYRGRNIGRRNGAD